jgi:hypothetical protein
MPSNYQHIDDFIRNKVQDIPDDNSLSDKYWQELQPSLQPAPAPVKPVGIKRFKPVLRYAAIVAGIALVCLYLLRIKEGSVNNNHLTNSPVSGNSDGVRVPVKDNLPSAVVVTTRPDGHVEKSIPPVEKKNRGIVVKSSSTTITATIDNRGNDPLVQPPNDTSAVAATMHMTNKKVFETFYKTLEKKAEEFTVNIKRDTTIYCREGSILFIPANSFETVSGLAISAMVKIYVKEFYEFADILGNKLTTQSGDRNLSTGGMLNIAAKANEEMLRLKNGAAIELTMPTRKFNSDMQLFVGNENGSLNDGPRQAAFVDGGETDSIGIAGSMPGARQQGINWMAAGQRQEFIKEQRKTITILNLTDNPYHIRSYKKNTKTMGMFAIPYNCPLSTSQVEYELEKRYSRFYDKIRVDRQGKGLFRSARKMKAAGIPKNEWYETNLVGDSITIPLKYAVPLRMISRSDSIAYEKMFREEFESAKKRKAAYAEYLELRNKYSFRISNLGWINCDRFMDYPASRVTEFNLIVDKKINPVFMQSMLVIKRENAAIGGYLNEGKINFMRIPVGEEVHIVCAAAQEGKMYACVQRFIVEKGKAPQLDMEEMTPDEFRRRVARIGNVVSLN